MVGSGTPRRTRLPIAMLTTWASRAGSRRAKPWRTSQRLASRTIEPTSATRVMTMTVKCEAQSCRLRRWPRRSGARRIGAPIKSRRGPARTRGSSGPTPADGAARGRELVADPPDRLDLFAERAELLAQSQDMGVNRAVEAARLVSPDPLHQILAGEG